VLTHARLGLRHKLLNSHFGRPYQNAFVIEHLLQINFINLPQEGHLIAAISPHNSVIVSLRQPCDKSVPVA
jgi:hypothetical protein